MTDNGIQLDLFGEVERAEAVAARRIAAKVEWQEQFRWPRFRLAYTCGSGAQGDEVTGWERPDCGGIELNACGLDREHGWDRDRPGARPGPQCQETGECLRQCWNRTRRVIAEREGRAWVV